MLYRHTYSCNHRSPPQAAAAVAAAQSRKGNNKRAKPQQQDKEGEEKEEEGLLDKRKLNPRRSNVRRQVRACVYMSEYMYAYVDRYMYTSSYIDRYMYMYSYIDQIRGSSYAHIHAYVCTQHSSMRPPHIHTHLSYAHTHTYIHMYTTGLHGHRQQEQQRSQQRPGAPHAALFPGDFAGGEPQGPFGALACRPRLRCATLCVYTYTHIYVFIYMYLYIWTRVSVRRDHYIPHIRTLKVMSLIDTIPIC